MTADHGRPTGFAELTALIRANGWLMRVLEAVRDEAIPDAWVGAGVLRDLVWGERFGTGFAPERVRDVDVVYFDPRDLSRAADDRWTGRLARRLPRVPWEARNQAAVHTWYHTTFGGEPVAPLTSIRDAVATWPETATAVAVRLGAGGTIEICAPLGLADLLGGVWRRNPRRAGLDQSLARLDRHAPQQRFPGVTVIPPGPVRYRSDEEDSGRWLEFPFRPGDIVISTRSKSGTTWMQMICALLVFQSPELPAPLASLSPWLDWLTSDKQRVYDHLAAQEHRRFIKTHTPLDGVPIDPGACYVVVARHPLDMAVSLYHQGSNIDRARVSELTGAPQRAEVAPRPLHDWLLRWVERDSDPRAEMDSLAGVCHHLTDAWQRRDEPNVRLVHYDDLLTDLAGEMRRLAAWLGIGVPPERWPALVEAATFASMRCRAETLVPDPDGVLKDRQAFFRRGRSGSGRDLLSPAELDRYHRRTAELAPPGLLAWLHR